MDRIIAQVQPIPDFTSECEVSVNANNAEVMTSCGNGIDYELSVSDPQIIGTPGCPGTILRYTYIVRDACGRTASDIQEITIENDGPTLTCPETLNIINCEDGDYNALIEAWLASVKATTACNGNAEVTNNFNGVNGLCITNGFTDVVFTATDDCGTTSTCVGTIIITDTEAPIIFEDPMEVLVPCNAVTRDIFDNWLATRGGAEAIDGCWGSDISWSMNPANPILDCDSGPQAIVVEFIATDGCGNSSSVIGVFNTKVQPTFIDVTGTIVREDSEPVENVKMNVTGGTGIPDINFTEAGGVYGFPELEYEENLVIAPEKNDSPINGVTTFDLIMMQRHLLGIEALDSPYKLIAADVNKSGDISTFDILLLRKLILVIDTDFENNTSWRFVETDFVFPNPQDPFESAFPEVYALSSFVEEEVINFVAIKVGDMNLTASTTAFTNDNENRTDLDDLKFEVEDQTLEVGEQYQIDFTAQNFEDILGFQFTIDFDPAALELIEIKGSNSINFDNKNYGLTKLKEGAITMSWNEKDFVNLNPDEIIFSLMVNAEKAVQLSEILSITSRYTRAEAYQSEGLLNVDLVFGTKEASVTGMFQLFQNQPNPFKEMTTIGFNLPKTEVVDLMIYDVSGRLIYSETATYTKGYNQIDLNRANLPAGVLYYHINTATDAASKKMILLD